MLYACIMTAFPELQVLGMHFVVRPSELSINNHE